MKALIKAAVEALGYRIQGTRYQPRQLLDPALVRSVQFDDVVCRRMMEVGPALNFIQVGVFDGVTNDPLRRFIQRFDWRGVLVEPQSRAAERLRALYAGSERIEVIQAALDGTTGQRTLYTVQGEGAPAWAGGLASFERDSITKHADVVPGVEAMISEEAVQCVDFDHVLERLAADRLDVLQIDTEGHDAYVLSLFPFDRVRPAIVHWEVKHLTMAQREDCLGRLARFGYRFAPSGAEDMLAVTF